MKDIPQMPDMERVRREHMRWLIILTLNNARPIGAAESVILTVAQAIYPDATPQELRRELDYLDERELVDITKTPDGRWSASSTRALHRWMPAAPTTPSTATSSSASCCR